MGMRILKTKPPGLVKAERQYAEAHQHLRRVRELAEIASQDWRTGTPARFEKIILDAQAALTRAAHFVADQRKLAEEAGWKDDDSASAYSSWSAWTAAGTND